MKPALRTRHHDQQGMTLLVALVMLLVIGLASAAVMRSSLNTDRVADNARLKTLASQAAQLALRYCETQVESSAPGLKIATVANPAHWLDGASWHGAGAIATTVPDSLMASKASSFTPDSKPQCLAEYTDTVSGVSATDAVIVTARGFSPDYAESGGLQTAGSVVWLQSTLIFH